MATQVIYEQQYFLSGWFEDSGKTLQSWWDRDLASGTPGTVPIVIPLDILEPGFWDDPDVIYLLDGSRGTPFPPPPVGPGHLPATFLPPLGPPSGITVWLVADFFNDDDLFFHPMSMRALGPPDQFLRNEVRRIR